MPIQTSYASTQPIGVPGAQADMRPAKFVSATVETAAIAFGKAVARGSADRTCVLWDNTPPGFLGVAALACLWAGARRLVLTDPAVIEAIDPRPPSASLPG